MPGSILAITTLFPFSLHTFHVVISISLSLILIETASFLLDGNKLPNSTNLARWVLGCAQKAQFSGTTTLVIQHTTVTTTRSILNITTKRHTLATENDFYSLTTLELPL